MKKKIDITKNIAVFEEKEVRRIWHNEQWYFSIIDIVAILSQSSRPRKYWDDLKRKLKEEGSEWQKAESPYLLNHQPPVGTIYVKAVDHAGNSTIENLTPNIPLEKPLPIFEILITILIIIIYCIL